MRAIATYAEQVLNENYKKFVSRWDEQNPEYDPYTISEWCDLESQSDPDFYGWLFNDPEISDFGSNLSDDEMKLASDFFESI